MVTQSLALLATSFPVSTKSKVAEVTTASGGGRIKLTSAVRGGVPVGGGVGVDGGDGVGVGAEATGPETTGTPLPLSPPPPQELNRQHIAADVISLRMSDQHPDRKTKENQLDS